MLNAEYIDHEKVKKEGGRGRDYLSGRCRNEGKGKMPIGSNRTISVTANP
jgi:hypothetical protein